MKKYIKNDLLDKDTYGDWCMPPETLNTIRSSDPEKITPSALIGTAYFYYEVLIMKKFAEVLNKPGDAEVFRVLASRMLNGLNSNLLYKNDSTYANNTATSSLLALGTKMAHQNYEQKIFTNLVDKIMGDADGHVACGLVGTQWMMRVLSDYGRPDIAYKIATCKTYPGWGYMVENGATTLWELWNGNTAAPDMNSANHVMLAGDLCLWLYEYLGGIKSDPAHIGFKHIIMKPLPVGDLKYVNSSYHSVYGLIESDWKINNDTFYWHVKIPVSTTATIYIPSSGEQFIKEGNKIASAAVGINFIKSESGRSVYEIGSGDYSFTSVYKPVQAETRLFVQTPVITPADNSVSNLRKIKVSITCETKGAEIRYSLDGSAPSKNALLYTKPFEISKSAVVKARAFKKDFVDSYPSSSVIDLYDPAVNGLRYEYYEGTWTQLPDFSELNALKSGFTQCFDPSKLKVKNDFFGLVFSGFINIPEDGEYVFFISSVDGSKLLIDGKVIATNDFAHLLSTASGKINLSKGKRSLRIEYFDGTLDKDALSVYMKGKKIPYQPVPLSLLTVE